MSAVPANAARAVGNLVFHWPREDWVRERNSRPLRMDWSHCGFRSKAVADLLAAPSAIAEVPVARAVLSQSRLCILFISFSFNLLDLRRPVGIASHGRLHCRELGLVTQWRIHQSARCLVRISIQLSTQSINKKPGSNNSGLSATSV